MRHHLNGPFEVRASLVVGAVGRSSLVREKAGLKVEEFGAPMDVLWLRRLAGDPEKTAGRLDVGHISIGSVKPNFDSFKGGFLK